MIFYDSKAAAAIKHGFITNEAGIRAVSTGMDGYNLILSSDQGNIEQPQVTIKGDEVYFAHDINVEEDCLAQGNIGFKNTSTRFIDESKSGLETRLRVNVTDSGGLGKTGLLVETGRVYCGEDINLTDLYCSTASCSSVVCSTLNSGVSTVSALTSTSINNSGTMSSGTFTCTGNIDCGTNSIISGTITTSIQPRLHLEVPFGVSQSVPASNVIATVNIYNTITTNIGGFGVTGNSTVTVPSTGYYLIYANTYWAATGTKNMWIKKNSLITTQYGYVNCTTLGFGTTVALYLNGGDTINVDVSQPNGSPVNMGTSLSAVPMVLDIYKIG